MQRDTQSVNNRTLWVFRVLAFAAAIGIPLLAYTSPEGAYDPLWQRVAASIWVLLPSALSFFSPLVRKYFFQAMYIALFVPNVWILHLVFKNDFHLIYSIAYSVCFLTSSIIFRHFWWMVGFLGGLFAASFFFYPLLDQPLMEPSYFYLGQGTSMLVVGIATERLLHERNLLVSRGEQFRSISRAAFDASSEGVLVTDLDTFALEYNQKFLDMWGLTREDMESGRIRPGAEKILGQLENPEVLNEGYHASKNNPHERIVQELHLLDGRIILRLSEPLTVRGQLSGRIWFFREVTEERAEKERLEKSQEQLAIQNEVLVQVASSTALHQADEQTALETILERGLEPLNINMVSVWRVNEQGDALSCIYAHGWHPGFQFEKPLALANHPNYHRTIRRVRQLVVMDVESDPLLQTQRIIHPKLTKYARIDIPFREKGRLKGIMIFHADEAQREWSPEEQSFAASLSDLIQFALESGRRRAAERAVQQSNAILQSVFELSGIGIIVTSKQGSLLDFNRTFAELWNVPKSLLQKGRELGIMEHLMAQVRGDVFDPLSARRLLISPAVNEYTTLQLYDGRIIERYVGKMEMEGAVAGHTWYFREVTTQIKAQMALRESEQRNRAILDAVPDLMLRINSRGELIDQKVPETEEYLGVRSMPIDSLISLFPYEFETEMRRKAAQVLVDGQVATMESQLQFLGRERDLEIRLVRSGEQEVLAIVRDVTQRKTTERELIQRNFELDSFVYRASHDLKAPLNSLMGLLDIIRMEELPPGPSQYLDLMDRSVVKLDTFIRNLTDFSRITRLEIQHKEVDFEHLLAEILESLKYMENSQRVRQDIEILSDCAFIGDQFHLSIVLTNLISNAIKYQDHSKDDPHVKIQVHISPEDARIVVADNGIGIPEKYQSRLFELFFRASNQSFGSGLGLYITQNAVEKMDGEVQLESEEGKGTSFHIQLPNHLGDEQAAEASAEA